MIPTAPNARRYELGFGIIGCMGLLIIQWWGTKALFFSVFFRSCSELTLIKRNTLLTLTWAISSRSKNERAIAWSHITDESGCVRLVLNDLYRCSVVRQLHWLPTTVMECPVSHVFQPPSLKKPSCWVQSSRSIAHLAARWRVSLHSWIIVIPVVVIVVIE